jgi:hypothetical protein
MSSSARGRSKRSLGYSGVVIIVSALLSSCGTYVPGLHEFWGTEDDAGSKVLNVAAQVRCELRKGIYQLITDDLRIARQFNQPRRTKFLESWGAQVTLTLSAVEKSGLTPGVSLIKPLNDVEALSTGLGAELSSEATRTGVVHFFFTVRELMLQKGNFGTDCIPSKPAQGFMVIESDLKLKEWLYAAIAPGFTSTVRFPNSKDGPFGQDVISHEVKFEIVTSGSVTPVWKLVRVAANDGGTLFAARRSRSQNLLVTLGPAETTPSGRAVLARPAENLHQAQQIGQAVGRAVRN